MNQSDPRLAHRKTPQVQVAASASKPTPTPAGSSSQQDQSRRMSLQRRLAEEEFLRQFPGFRNK